MNFLGKKLDSKILSENIVYKLRGNNQRLRDILIVEQFNYCAYTEKYLTHLDQPDVEHFDSSKKDKDDDYFNYYVVITKANKYKKDEKYIGASFFINKFYQNKQELEKRIGFRDNVFYEKNENDIEARDFIDFLGLNHPSLSKERSIYVNRISELFGLADFPLEKIKSYFIKYPSELSFITALSDKFNYDFMEMLS